MPICSVLEVADLFVYYWTGSCAVEGKETDRVKEMTMALVALDKPLFGEILHQRYIDELPMKAEDFQMLLPPPQD